MERPREGIMSLLTGIHALFQMLMIRKKKEVIGVSKGQAWIGCMVYPSTPVDSA
jgi:hypothetical protein